MHQKQNRGPKANVSTLSRKTIMKRVIQNAAPAWIAPLLLMPASSLFAAETVTHIPPDTTVTELQVLLAPAADDVHRLWNQGTLQDAGGWGSAVVVQGSGEGATVIDNESVIRGRLDFSGLNGGATFNNAAGASWEAYAETSGVQMIWSAGNDVLNNAEGGLVNVWHEYFSQPMTFDFGAGQDAVANSGNMTLSASVKGLEILHNAGHLFLHNVEGLRELVNSGNIRIEDYLSFEDASTIENSGNLDINGYNIQTGIAAYVDAPGLARFENSGVVNLVTGIPVFTNRLIIDGADFVGLPGSRLDLEVYFADVGQAGCELASTGAADCVSIRGGTTSGVTSIRVDVLTADKGAAFLNDGYVLVDVRGGQSEAGHFVLDPGSDGYEADAPLGGGVRADEMFTYHLLYDAATQTHRLMGLPDLQTQVLGVVPTIAQSLWRTAESSAVARQSELRTRKSGGGMWFKAADSQSDREANVKSSLIGNPIDVAVSHEQEDKAYSFGIDMTGGEEATRYSLGISFGDVSSEFTLNDLGTQGEIEAISFAVYGSYQRGAFFFDLSGSGYSGELEGTLALQANDYTAYTTVDAVGGRAETGYRLSFGKSFAIEPLLSVVYVRSGIGAVQHLSGNKNNGLLFDTASSLRGGAGAKAELDLALASLRLSFSLAARAWEEFKGESKALVRTIRDPFPFASTFDGSFTEVDAAIGIDSASGMLSGYVAFGSRFGDDYDSTMASLGVRYNW